MVDLIGQRLGQYEITAMLGEGGMACGVGWHTHSKNWISEPLIGKGIRMDLYRSRHTSRSSVVGSRT